MTIPKRVQRQRDFSAGELLGEARRRDDIDVVRAGARQMKNWRIEASANLKERQGRTAVLAQSGRTEIVRLSSSEAVLVSFDHTGSSGRVRVLTQAGAVVATNTGYPWSPGGVSDITFAVVNRDIVLCYPGMRPQVVRVPAGLGSAIFSAFAFSQGFNAVRQEPFYRLPDSFGITLTPSARSGTITLTASAAWFNAGHVGSVVRWAGRQVLISGFTSSTLVTGLVLETLPQTYLMQVDATVAGFEVGQVIEGETSGFKGQIVAILAGSPNNTLAVVMDRPGTGSGGTYEINENLIGPAVSAVLVSAVASSTPAGTTVWDESFMSDYRGWPASVSFDRSRLIFCDFPQLPEGVCWSTIGLYQNFLIDTSADSAIFELVPGKVRVQHVAGGADQFVFTDRAVFYIPISAANPLKPGSIEFREITSEGAARVRPVAMTEGILYVVAGGKRVSALIVTGQTARPYLSRDASKYHLHLFSGVRALAASQGNGDYPERYVYAVNEDGTMAVGRFEETREWIGWVPWDGAGLATWVSADSDDVYFQSDYNVGSGTYNVLEKIDDAVLTDCTVSLDDIPAGLAAPVGKGPLWFVAGATVSVVRNGRDFGVRSVDADGAILWLDDDDSDAPGWEVGFSFECVLEPFLHQADDGQSFRQSMRRRRVAQSMVTATHSGVFSWADREVSAYRSGDDMGALPPVREASYSFRHLGRAHDPRLVLTRARPGRLSVIELALEVTI